MTECCKFCIHHDACADADVLNTVGDCPTFSDIGEWIHLPIKSGSIVYYVHNQEIVEVLVFDACLNFITMLYKGVYWKESWDGLNKGWFLTREYAENFKAAEEIHK